MKHFFLFGLIVALGLLKVMENFMSIAEAVNNIIGIIRFVYRQVNYIILSITTQINILILCIELIFTLIETLCEEILRLFSEAFAFLNKSEPIRKRFEKPDILPQITSALNNSN